MQYMSQKTGPDTCGPGAAPYFHGGGALDGRPPLPMRLLCDEMLQGLGRWLRAAGYDTAVAASGASDRQLLATIHAEGRLLLTCDRGFRTAGEAFGHFQLLSGSGLESLAAELSRHFQVDWLHAPFTRCLLDNSPLRAATEPESLRVPAKARGLAGPITACPACERLYWPGSHVRRMRARLAAWQGF